jgi:hypothetical protein
VVRALGMRAMMHVVGQTRTSLAAAVSTAERAIEMAAELGTGGDHIAHVVRGRAQLGLGDGDGLDELEEWLDQVLTHESATLGLGCRQWLAGALHHWRGPGAEWQARKDLEALAQERGLQVIASMGIAEEVRVLYELGKLREAIERADTIGSIPDAQPRWRWFSGHWPCSISVNSMTRHLLL